MTQFSELFKSDDRAGLTRKPRARMDELLSRADTADAVQALDPIEFYDLYHGVGPGDAVALLEYASPEQLQTCLDLDIWRGDQMSDVDIAPWVEQMLTLPDNKFEEFWKNIDPELMALYLHRNIRLYVAEDKNDEVNIPEEESPNVAQTPDFTYWVAYPEDPDKADLLRQLIDRMYAVLGVEKAWATLEGMHFELETDLEETAYRFRTERIREFGFMPRDEAAAIFANVNVEKEADSIRKSASADLYIQPYPSTQKLDHALARMDDTPAAGCFFSEVLSQTPNREAIRIQLFSIAQQIAVFDGFQPHEDQGFADSMLLAVSYANMGLEYSSQYDEEVAVHILKHTPLKRLVTLGYSLTVELRRKARILISRGHLSIIEDQPMSLLTTRQRDAVEGMLLDRPRPGSSALTPFVSMNDIREAAATIADIATRELFFGEALHKTRDDISLLAYTHELVQGVENISFDNVAVTWLTRKALRCSEPWGVFFADELPERNQVIDAIRPENILSLFKSSIPPTTTSALTRFANQLKASVNETWPESERYPDPILVSALVIADHD